MAIYTDAAVSPDALTTFIRRIPGLNTPGNPTPLFTLEQYLPVREINDIEVSFNDVTLTTRTAQVRAWDAPPSRGERDSFSVRRARLLPVSQMLGRGEKDRIDLERLRTGGTNFQAAIDAIFDDAANITLAVRARVELARGDVLTDGKVTISNENGVTTEADFGVPGTHFVAPGILWSSVGTATIVDDISAWVDVYVADNGTAPGGMVISKRVLNYMLQNAQIRNLAASLSGTPNLITRPALAGALEAYGLPQIVEVYDTQVSVGGVNTRVIPDDRVVFVPPAGVELGYTYFGLSATALELQNTTGFNPGPGLVGVVDKDVRPPYRETTYIDGTFMPVITNPKALFVADVA
jgi:hypothetical protein